MAYKIMDLSQKELSQICGGTNEVINQQNATQQTAPINTISNKYDWYTYTEIFCISLVTLVAAGYKTNFIRLKIKHV